MKWWYSGSLSNRSMSMSNSPTRRSRKFWYARYHSRSQCVCEMTIRRRLSLDFGLKKGMRRSHPGARAHPKAMVSDGAGLVVAHQRMDVVFGEARAPPERRELDEEQGAIDNAADQLDELDCGVRCAAGREQVIDHERAVAPAQCVGV